MDVYSQCRHVRFVVEPPKYQGSESGIAQVVAYKNQLQKFSEHIWPCAYIIIDMTQEPLVQAICTLHNGYLFVRSGILPRSKQYQWHTLASHEGERVKNGLTQCSVKFQLNTRINYVDNMTELNGKPFMDLTSQ